MTPQNAECSSSLAPHRVPVEGAGAGVGQGGRVRRGRSRGAGQQVCFQAITESPQRVRAERMNSDVFAGTLLP